MDLFICGNGIDIPTPALDGTLRCLKVYKTDRLWPGEMSKAGIDSRPVLIWGCAISMVLFVLAVSGVVVLARRRRSMQARERLKRQILETQKPSPQTYHHPQFSMMKSNSIPFIPVSVSPTTSTMQSKIYDVRPLHTPYRTPYQPNKQTKFSMLNSM